MANQKEKTINYRRAMWIENQNTNKLEHFIRLMDEKLGSVEDKTICFAGKNITCAKLKLLEKGGILIHIVTETPGEAASIIPHVTSSSTEIDVDVTSPPEDAEFMDGDAFLLVHGNDVCICTTGVQDGGIRAYLSETFKKAKLSNSSTKFDLLKVADVNKIGTVLQQGVKEIDLRSTMFQASADYTRRKHKPDGIIGAAAKHFRAIFGSEHDVTDDNLSISLSISIDKRRKGQITVGTERINKTAVDLLNDDEYDDYAIILNNGQRISRDEITLNTKVNIKAKGKSVDREGAWDELGKFYLQLKGGGATEQ
jgi:hypothetical protein